MSTFDGLQYIASYPDLIAAFGANSAAGEVPPDPSSPILGLQANAVAMVEDGRRLESDPAAGQT